MIVALLVIASIELVVLVALFAAVGHIVSQTDRGIDDRWRVYEEARAERERLLEQAAAERERLLDRVQSPLAVAARDFPVPEAARRTDAEVDDEWMARPESEVAFDPDLVLADMETQEG